MEIPLLRRIMENLAANLTFAQDLSVIWHSGEPLVLGPDYYSEAITVIREALPPEISVEYDIQTNGTLLTERWRTVYLRPDVSVGLSLDGPQEIHDGNRPYRDGRGSFDKAIAALRLLRREGKDPSVVCVVDFAHMDEPDRYFDFFLEEGVRHLSFNVPEREGANVTGLAVDAGAQQAFSRFMARFYRRNRDEGRPFALTHIDAMANRLRLARGAPPRSQEHKPLAIVTVGSDGRFSTFSPELLGFAHARHGDFRIGRASPDFHLDHGRLGAMAHEIEEGLRACEERCRYFAVCGGGRPSAKYFESRTFAVDAHESCLVNTRWLAEAVAGEILAESDAFESA